jgi:hypothetical protein
MEAHYVLQHVKVIFKILNPFEGLFPIYIISLQVAFLSSLPVFFIKNRKVEKNHLLIAVVLLLVMLLESYGSYSSNRSNTNILYFNFGFVYLETVLLITYFLFINVRTFIKTSLLTSLAIFTGWFLINFILFQPIDTHFQTNSYLLGSLLLIIFSGNFFYEIFTFKRYSKDNLLAIPHFYIVTGIFFFYSASFMHFISLQIPDIDKEFINAIYPFIRFLSSLMYILMGVAFYAPIVFRRNKMYLSDQIIHK